jgi:excinuclease UvrABC nuclease subunit
MISIHELKLLPQTSGIYKVLDHSGNVVYVGQAKNIRDRWKNGHHKLSVIVAKYGTSFYIDWVEVPEWLLNRAEHAAVSFYQPSLNLKTPPVV